MTVENLSQLVKMNNTAKANRVGGKAKAMDFGGMLDAVSAMGSTVGTAASMYGGSNASAVLSAAFSGIGAGSQQMAGASGGMGGGMGGMGMSGMGTADYTTGVPSLAGGYNSTGFKASSTSTTSSVGGLTDSSSAVVSGTDGFSQMDMINTMNQNNLQLLELQAVMQSNSQAWNTKSNILSADHRARMAMIEKFTAR